MNSQLLSLSLAVAAGLLTMPFRSDATVYTFDVDSSSGLGTGSFTIDLPDSWPGNLGQTTTIRTTSCRGFYGRGDLWTSIMIVLSEFIEQSDNAALSGTSKKQVTFKAVAIGVGITPVEAVESIPGVTRRAVSVARGGPGWQRPVSRCAAGGWTVQTPNRPESRRGGEPACARVNAPSRIEAHEFGCPI